MPQSSSSNPPRYINMQPAVTDTRTTTNGDATAHPFPVRILDPQEQRPLEHAPRAQTRLPPPASGKAPTKYVNEVPAFLRKSWRSKSPGNSTCHNVWRPTAKDIADFGTKGLGSSTPLASRGMDVEGSMSKQPFTVSMASALITRPPSTSSGETVIYRPSQEMPAIEAFVCHRTLHPLHRHPDSKIHLHPRRLLRPNTPAGDTPLTSRCPPAPLLTISPPSQMPQSNCTTGTTGFGEGSQHTSTSTNPRRRASSMNFSYNSSQTRSTPFSPSSQSRFLQPWTADIWDRGSFTICCTGTGLRRV